MTIEHESDTSDAMLTPAEARVLGCLMEKQRTTPDQYPLTLNSLVSACNQKSARHPVTNMTPGEVGHVVNQLRDRGLIYASLSGRTERYDHKIVGTFLLSREEHALLCALMLRGPQTTGELRTNTARLADFKDLEQSRSGHRRPSRGALGLRFFARIARIFRGFTPCRAGHRTGNRRADTEENEGGAMGVQDR